MRFGMIRGRRFALFDDHFNRSTRRIAVNDFDKRSLEVEIFGVRLSGRRPDEQLLLSDPLKAGFDLVIKLADGFEVDVVGLGRVCGGARHVSLFDLGGDAFAQRVVQRLALGTKNTRFRHLIADKTLDEFLRERFETNGNSKWKRTCGNGEIRTLEVWRSADRGQQIRNLPQVEHLFHRHAGEFALPR